ncbi:MAG TPA: hypothetical protein VGI73_01520 [Solirubrobacterales bacterium]
MLLRRLRQIRLRDERGLTLAEMVVAMGAGGVVLMGTTVMVLGTMHATTKVDKRVEATQNSRIVLTKLIDELNSSCVMPKMAPVQQQSTSTVLRFVHGSGSAVTPTPTLSVVRLQGTTLMQEDFALREGVAPNWVFEEAKPVAVTQLMTGVTQISATNPPFRYYPYSTTTGATSETALSTPLSIASAQTVIQVGVALRVAPSGSSDETVPAHIEDSASLRLTAASYQAVPSLPCQ